MLTNESDRARAVYRAEFAAGIAVLRPLATIHDAQALVNHVIRRPFWRRYSNVKKVTLKYVPDWARESSCGWTEAHLADMELSVGSLCEGLVYHELAHLAKRDLDNGHRTSFLRLQFAIIHDTTNVVADVFLPRYARELLQRELVTGRETWLKPWLNA